MKILIVACYQFDYEVVVNNVDGDLDTNNHGNTGCYGMLDGELSTGVAPDDQLDEVHPPECWYQRFC